MKKSKLVKLNTVLKAGIVHASIGKVSFSDEKLVENFKTLQDVLAKAKPSSAKGTYFKSVAVTTTMGPELKLILHHSNYN